MNLYEQIKKTYPELNNEFINGTVILQNDSDGKGDYIAVWDYEKPIPDGLKLGKDEE